MMFRKRISENLIELDLHDNADGSVSVFAFPSGGADAFEVVTIKADGTIAMHDIPPAHMNKFAVTTTGRIATTKL